MADSEVFSAVTGARVAQFFEKVQLTSKQAVTRSYTWKTAGLAAGKYILRQGLFSSDWKISFGWDKDKPVIATLVRHLGKDK